MKARALFLTVLVGLAACSSSGPSPSPSSATSPALAQAPASSAPPVVSSSSPSSSATPPPASSTPLGITIYGVAHPGDEAGCVVLIATNNRVYALLGGDRQVITAGGQLAVTGHVVIGLQNQKCREGIPFEVSVVRPD